MTKSSPAAAARTPFLPREGLYWVTIAAVLGCIGLFKGLNLVLLLACLMFALWVMNGLLAGQRLRRLGGKRRVEGPVFALTPFLVHLNLTNTGAAPVQGIRLEDHGPAGDIIHFAPHLEAGATATFSQELTLPSRGRHAWPALTATSAFPFGLVRRRRLLTHAEEVIVLPALGRLHRGRLREYLTPVGYYQSYGRSAARRHPSAQAEFHGLRAFHSGDSPRLIHWRTSARCGELMVREFEDVPNDNLVLIVDPTCSNGAADDRSASSSGREQILSLAATICWEWCRQKGDRLVLVVAGAQGGVIDGVTSPGLAVRMLECLAVQIGQGMPPPHKRCQDPFLPQKRVLTPFMELLLPPAPLLALSVQPNGLADELSQHFNQPVAALDAASLREIDFYEGPPLQLKRS